MPIYMDRHFTEGATRRGIEDAHEKDLVAQDKYGVKFITYWFDEARSTGFCLVESPNKAAIQHAHDDAHGDVPHEIIEVDPAVVAAFLGRVSDPVPDPASGQVTFDSAFRVIMFTDLKDSTLMTTMYGDQKALHLLHVHNLLTRNALNDHKGREVKHTGDGIMASFTNTLQAVQCAQAIQRAFTEYNQKNPEEALYVRIGLSAGEPIEEAGDLFGSTVQLAARLCALAEPGQILISDSARATMPQEHLSALIDQGKVDLKGFDQSKQIYAIRSQ